MARNGFIEVQAGLEVDFLEAIRVDYNEASAGAAIRVGPHDARLGFNQFLALGKDEADIQKPTVLLLKIIF